MRALRLPTLLLFTVLAAPSDVTAEPTFLLHAAPADFGACDALDIPSMRCGDDDFEIAPNGLEEYFVWVIVSDVSQIKAAEFGISYESTVNVATWVSCDLLPIPFPGWPGSDTGIALAWGECHQTPSNSMAKLGFFYVNAGSSGPMRIIENPGRDYGLAIVDCTESYVRGCQHNGRLVFDGTGGYLPDGCRCSGPPAVEASWSAIKAQYRD